MSRAERAVSTPVLSGPSKVLGLLLMLQPRALIETWNGQTQKNPPPWSWKATERKGEREEGEI